MVTKSVFLASSNELVADRRAFEQLIGRQNKYWHDRGFFLEAVIWEDFLDAMSPTRLQDTYNQRIRQCDLFVLLFWTKVGKYTEEEFTTAVGEFRTNGKPLIFTYFKDLPNDGQPQSPEDLHSLKSFKERLSKLGHFYTTYQNVEGLQLHFLQQLQRLGLMDMDASNAAGPTGGTPGSSANLQGSGAIAQNNSTALGAGAVFIQGNPPPRR